MKIDHLGGKRRDATLRADAGAIGEMKVRG